MTMTFKNVAKYALTKTYMVFRSFDGDHLTKWFYAADDDRALVNRIAMEVGGEVWQTADIADRCEVSIGGW